MDVVYVITSSSPEMTATPGDLLASELARLGETKQKLAERLGVKWPTIHRWVQNIGFTKKNRVHAALALGLQPDAFEAPDETTAHRVICEEALEDFLRSHLAPPDLSEGEKVYLRTMQIPLQVRPTRYFYAQSVFNLRGQATKVDLEKELKLNEALARSVDEKLRKIEEIAKDFEERRQAAAERGKRRGPGKSE